MKLALIILSCILISCNSKNKSSESEVSAGEKTAVEKTENAPIEKSTQKSAEKATETTKREETAETADHSSDSVKISLDSVKASAADWQGNLSYNEGDVIQLKGKFWVALRKVYQNTPPPDSWFWREITDKIENSPKKSSDAYNKSVTYDSGSVVTWQGKRYVAKRHV